MYALLAKLTKLSCKYPQSIQNNTRLI